MRIDNYYLAPAMASPAEPRTTAESPQGSGTSASRLTESSAHAVSAELSTLIDLVKSQPEVRPEAVDAARSKWIQGVFATPASAAQTADAILQAPE